MPHKSKGKTTVDRILELGNEVAYQEWDSGGPGAGAGRISVRRYRRKFYVFDDDGMFGPFSLFADALRARQVALVTSATQTIWRLDKGFLYRNGVAVKVLFELWNRSRFLEVELSAHPAQFIIRLFVNGKREHKAAFKTRRLAIAEAKGLKRKYVREGWSDLPE